MLVGKELLKKSKLLSKKSEDEIARGCGYVGPSGRVLRKSFYRALIEAKGYKLGNSGPGRAGNRSVRGRQAVFKTKVHGNGNLLIGHAYTKKLGLTPGQEFKIDIKKNSKSINVINGGRYDKLISDLGSKKEVPAVGAALSLNY